MRRRQAFHLVLPVLLKDGNLLDKAVGREDGVKGFHSHRVSHVLDLCVTETSA